MKIEDLHQLFLKFPYATTDTRKIIEKSIFFALKGNQFNGNEFAQNALDKGAAYAIVDDEEFVVSDKTILVTNVLQTLQELACYHRNHCKAKIIGLTGSNGKTTTKELISIVLSKKYRTIATKGNLNNHIGVPLTLLSIRENTEIAVVEMGANHMGEIAFLCSLAQPDYGYITNFGKAHLEGFGSEEGVILGKSELYEFLMGKNRTIFFNADDPVQQKKLNGYGNKLGFSRENGENYQIKFEGAHPFVTLEVAGQIIRSKLIGNYNFMNCCAAVLMGKYLEVPILDIKIALEGFTPQNNRSQIIEKNGNHIILDAYNANPTSMKAALETFEKIPGNNKIAFLGDMFELGETAHKEHQYIANLAKELNLNNVYLVGSNFNRTNTTYTKLGTFHDLKSKLAGNPPKNATILIKGSRGMALERILDLL
ncbi:UDP-N-acetylmuramoyl-tripeptide--D-alanyl-D-alanine ligase [Flavobacteriaceae bacterium F89]|uniref:UDP-N-acetylmuramoyl-tripeptide--D-alanyl-D-alanine ligase n=1 Tax=Cerina litoralis TaxID=2874477 RepID=A0AAE3EV88_9FLAO|nr:UDP-N-acetylmuramoyl-tripeptide--D-alanyl-D-alanine ligase [Cerina litoralis]MCG2461697.1 UDP-N-acetylmuramoyl-tripeptide--D-alanyl-D-alanine ligase [Cerina litoralis]